MLTSKMINQTIWISSVLLLSSANAQIAFGETSAKLEGKVTNIEIPPMVCTEVERLTALALKKDEKAQEVDKLVAKFRTNKSKACAAAKEAAYTMVPYRGFGPSKEGANIVLEKLNKIKTLTGAEYVRQKVEDDMHLDMSASVLQVTMALDCTDPLRSKQMLEAGQARLNKLIGEEEANKVIASLRSWKETLNIPTSAYEQSSWDVDQFQKNLHEITRMAIHADPMLESIVKKVKKMDRSKASVIASGVISSGLCVASWATPGMFMPMGVELLHAGYITATGGNEDTKLVRTLFYQKSIESRWHRINEETQLALTHYQLAKQQKNPALLAASESMLIQLIGQDRVAKQLGQSVLATQGVKPDLPLRTSESNLLGILNKSAK